MSDREHSIFMIGRNTICPVCSGFAVAQSGRKTIKCIDCGEKFKIKGIGQTEREMICEQL